MHLCDGQRVLWLLAAAGEMMDSGCAMCVATESSCNVVQANGLVCYSGGWGKAQYTGIYVARHPGSHE